MKRTTSTQQTYPFVGASHERKLMRAIALAGVVALGATTIVLAISPSARAYATHTGMHGHDMLLAEMHGGRTPEQMHAHFDKVLTEAGASEAQKRQIHTIMKDAMTAGHADMQAFHASCSRLKTLLTASTIDDAAVATVRAEQDRLVLATSHRLADAMVAVAKILNPAQRAKLGAEIDRMMDSRDMHHSGG